MVVASRSSSIRRWWCSSRSDRISSINEKRRARVSAPFFIANCLEVTLGDPTSVVHADPGADHAHDERSGESDCRAKSPAGVTSGRRTDKRKELSHTGWTNRGMGLLHVKLTTRRRPPYRVSPRPTPRSGSSRVRRTRTASRVPSTSFPCAGIPIGRFRRESRIAPRHIRLS